MNVVGITRGFSKKTEKPFTVLHVVGDFDDFQAKFSDGNKAENIYIGKEVDVNLGDDVELEYGVGFQGKAIVLDIKAI